MAEETPVKQQRSTKHGFQPGTSGSPESYDWTGWYCGDVSKVSAQERREIGLWLLQNCGFKNGLTQRQINLVALLDQEDFAIHAAAQEAKKQARLDLAAV